MGWVRGTVLRVESEGTYTVELEDGNIERHITIFDIRPLSSVQDTVSSRRSSFLGDKFEKERTSNYSDSLYRKGDRVACYWYRISSLGGPKSNKRPKVGLVLCHNADSTYTVQLESDGSVIDDVLERHLKAWEEGQADLDSHIQARSPSNGPRSGPALDKWQAVLEMGNALKRQGKIKHSVPVSLSSIDDYQDIRDKLNEIIGKACVRDFEENFEGRDQHGDGEINYDQVLLAFSDLGKESNENELRKWARKIGKDGRAQKLFDFFDFVIAYANIFYPSTIIESSMKNQDDIAVRKPLIPSDALKFPGGFAKSFGKKDILEVENVFDTYAKRNRDGVLSMRKNDVFEAFQKLDRSVAKHKIQNWLDDNMSDSKDAIRLEEFQSVYAYFFATDSNKEAEQVQSYGGVRTISEVSVQVLQEGRWRGSTEQTNDLIRRLSSGRSESAVECIVRVRDAFESLDSRDLGEVSSSDVTALLKQAKITGPGVPHNVSAFKAKLDKQSRGTFVLPELYEQFGLDIQELSDASVSVSAAFSMMKMTLSAADVRAAADIVVRIIDALLEHPNDPKYWQLNVRSEVRTIQ